MTTPDYAGIRARLAAATEALSPEAAQVVSVPIPLREASALLAERDDLLVENQLLRDTIQAVEKVRDVYRLNLPPVANLIDLALDGRTPADVLRDRALGVSGE